MIAYTDYPLTSAHRKAGKSKFRRVTVLSYDGDKYCRIKYGSRAYEVKAGYLFEDPGGLRRIKLEELPAT